MKKQFRKKVLAVVTAAVLTISVGAVSALAAVSGNQTVRTALNMRSGMSTKSNNVMLVIPSGGTVSIISAESNNWYKVTYNGKTGYIKGGYFGTPESSSTTKTMYEDLNMRSSMDKSSSKNIIAVIKKGRTVTILNKESNGWYKVSYNGKTGYIMGGHFTDDTSRVGAKDAETGGSTTKTMAENLNMRSSMSKSSPSNIITVIPKGKSVTILNKESGGWYKVSYNGKTGYIMGGHFTDDTSRVGAKDAEPSYGTMTTTQAVNLRNAANSSTSKVLLTIPGGKKVTYVGVSGNWYKVTYNGTTGYVYKSYVK